MDHATTNTADDDRAPLERGRDAFERGAWRAAYDALSRADEETPLGGADLWLLGAAAYLLGRGDDFLAALERAHHLHVEAGEARAAARVAFWMGFHLINDGELGPATGWFGRATRILDEEGGDCAERGYLLLPQAHRHLATGDGDASFSVAGEAAAIGQRFRDQDLLALALHIQGRALMRQARVPEGLALLDEAMVAVAGGELSPVVTGLLYCSVIGACREVYSVRRAREWTAALKGWCDRHPDMVAYSGECRVYRAEILQMRGAWRDAIEEAGRAHEAADHGLPQAAASLAFYQQGEVHRLLGEYDAAEAAYQSARRLGREPQPGLALLRLAQGDDDAAAAASRRTLGETLDPLRRARLLPAHIEVMLAVGDVDEARSACAELERIGTAYDTGVFGTLVDHARGAIELAAGDAMAALVPLRRACQGWQALDAPYEVARVRVLIARACRALDDDDTAALEIDAARAAFEELGAEPDLARLDTGPPGPAGPSSAAAARGADHRLTARELEVLALVATGRTNRAIGEALFISEKTVARHVANIFAKLGLSSRAAATAFAYEHDLARPPA